MKAQKHLKQTPNQLVDLRSTHAVLVHLAVLQIVSAFVPVFATVLLLGPAHALVSLFLSLVDIVRLPSVVALVSARL